MGNVDAVPVASQVKSVVCLSRGDSESAWHIQRNFTQQCIGVAQIRLFVEVSHGDIEAAAETQRQFLNTTRRVLNRSEVVDSVPGLSQWKARLLEEGGESEAALQTRANFTSRCLGVSQALSLFDLIDGRKEHAVERQNDFLHYSSVLVDKVPLVGHAKACVHRSLGEQRRAEQALTRANQSASDGFQSLKQAYHDITSCDLALSLEPPTYVPQPQVQRRSELPVESSTADGFSLDGTSEQPPYAPQPQVQRSELPVESTTAEGLTLDQISENTLSFLLQADQCASFTACPVCMQEFSEGDFGTTLQCFHMFHSSCVIPWLQRSGNCPVCRAEAVSSQIVPAIAPRPGSYILSP